MAESQVINSLCENVELRKQDLSALYVKLIQLKMYFKKGTNQSGNADCKSYFSQKRLTRSQKQENLIQDSKNVMIGKYTSNSGHIKKLQDVAHEKT